MLYYLDTNIVIYAVEGLSPFQQRARNHLAALENAGHCFVVSELTCTECLVLPLRAGNGPLVLDNQRFYPGAASDHGFTVGGGPPTGSDDSGRPPLRTGGFAAPGRRRGKSDRSFPLERLPPCRISRPSCGSAAMTNGLSPVPSPRAAARQKLTWAYRPTQWPCAASRARWPGGRERTAWPC